MIEIDANSKTRYITTRTTKTYLDLLSEIGGLLSSLYPIFAILVSSFSALNFKAKNA
jgi:hypothetical protein